MKPMIALKFLQTIQPVKEQCKVNLLFSKVFKTPLSRFRKVETKLYIRVFAQASFNNARSTAPRHKSSAIRRKTFIACILSAMLANTTYAERPRSTLVVNVPKPQNTDFDASYVHAEELLKLALALSSPGNEEIEVKRNVSAAQDEALGIIEQGGGIDVYWVGTSIEREQRLLPVRIPIMKGLLGFRMSLLHKDTARLFYDMRMLEDIYQFSACLGADWPDADIFSANGFNVVRSHEYRGLIADIMQKRCDFLPLSVSEINAEYKDVKTDFPDIRLYNRVVFHYPFPMYFFVNKNNSLLAKRIELGLEKAIDTGAFDAYMRKSPVTRHLFPLEGWANVRFVTMKNPLLPTSTDTNNARYWIQLSSAPKKAAR